MSKSEENPVGVISLFDDVETIKSKIMKATTDSLNSIKYDPENQPGISNLMNIVVSLTDITIPEIEKMFEGKGYGEFKKYVAEVTSNHIALIQEKYNELINSDKLDEILNDGMEKSRKLAKEKYELMKKKMGTTREII